MDSSRETFIIANIAIEVGKIIDTFSPGMTPNVDDVRHQLKGALEQWKTNLPPEFHSIDVEPFSVGKWLLHLAYKCVYISVTGLEPDADRLT